MRLIKPSYQMIAATGCTDLPFSYDFADTLIERCGRLCYKSEEKTTPTSAVQFVMMLKRRGHYAMIEHSWKVAKFDSMDHPLWPVPENPFLKIAEENRWTRLVGGNIRAWEESGVLEDIPGDAFVPDKDVHDIALQLNAPQLMAATVHIICDRGVTHELVRHRPVSYAQESTRWCNYGGGVTFVIPPWINFQPSDFSRDETCSIDPKVLRAFGSETPEGYWLGVMDNAASNYGWLLGLGWAPQQARSVLPNSLKTEIIVTADLQEWQHIFSLRTAHDAHPQMREVMNPLLAEFKRRWPIFFAEIPDGWDEDLRGWANECKS